MEIDRRTLKALAADTRLDILKSLGKRRKMPSELSKELGLATSTVVEHLNRLEQAGLVIKQETGHKWIYYSLTQKGSSLVKPKVPMQFVIVIGIIAVVMVVGIFYTTSFTPLQASGTMKENQDIEDTALGLPERMITSTNANNFELNAYEGECLSGTTEVNGNVAAIGRSGRIVFSGFVKTSTPCNSLEGEYYVDGEYNVVEMRTVEFEGACAACVGIVTFDGYLEMEQGVHNLRFIYDGQVLQESSVTVV